MNKKLRASIPALLLLCILIGFEQAVFIISSDILKPPIVVSVKANVLTRSAMVEAGDSQSLQSIPSKGRIAILELMIWEDPEGTIPKGPIDWGVLEPGENGTAVIYIENDGNVNFTASLWTGNWSSPEAEMYLRLEWDYDGGILRPNVIYPITLKLVVSPDITSVKDFSFDIGVSIANAEPYP